MWTLPLAGLLQQTAERGEVLHVAPAQARSLLLRGSESEGSW